MQTYIIYELESFLLSEAFRKSFYFIFINNFRRTNQECRKGL